MIVLDIETTGLTLDHCMVSLGAVDYDSGNNFYGECKVYGHSFVESQALAINGFSFDQIKDESKPYAHELYADFLDWTKQFEGPLILGGHNIGHFDALFLEKYHKMLLQGTVWPFGYRTVDLHSVAYFVLGKSLSHEKICEALGLPPERKPHNALMGALSERDAFRMLFTHNPNFAVNTCDIFKGITGQTNQSTVR